MLQDLCFFLLPVSLVPTAQSSALRQVGAAFFDLRFLDSSYLCLSAAKTLPISLCCHAALWFSPILGQVFTLNTYTKNKRSLKVSLCVFVYTYMSVLCRCVPACANVCGGKRTSWAVIPLVPHTLFLEIVYWPGIFQVSYTG